MSRFENFFRNQKGFSLVEILTAVGVSSVVIAGTSYLVIASKKVEASSLHSFWLSARRIELQSLIKSDNGWSAILAANPSMNCLNDASGCAAYRTEQPLKIPISGTTLDGSLDTTGMSEGGDFCQSFDATSGSSSCPIGIKLSWFIICDDLICKHGQPKLMISFQRKSSAAAPLENLVSYDLVVFKDPKFEGLNEVCSSLGGVLAGVNCVLPQLNTLCDPSSGQFVLGFDASGAPICGKPGVGSCSGTDVVTGISASGGVICSPGCL